MDSLTGFRVEVHPVMKGAKAAVLIGGVLHVSPAMYDLMSHADEEELARLLAAIRVVNIPPFTPYGMPMTTGPNAAALFAPTE